MIELYCEQKGYFSLTVSPVLRLAGRKISKETVLTEPNAHCEENCLGICEVVGSGWGSFVNVVGG